MKKEYKKWLWLIPAVIIIMGVTITGCTGGIIVALSHQATAKHAESLERSSASSLRADDPSVTGVLAYKGVPTYGTLTINTNPFPEKGYVKTLICDADNVDIKVTVNTYGYYWKVKLDGGKEWPMLAKGAVAEGDTNYLVTLPAFHKLEAWIDPKPGFKVTEGSLTCSMVPKIR